MFHNLNIPVIDVEELLQIMNEKQSSLQLIDVREPEEINIAAIEGFEPLPLSQFQQWGETIGVRFDSTVETIVICHHGIRSAQMCQWLLNRGFTNVKNVMGGIDAYSVRIDPTIPRY